MAIHRSAYQSDLLSFLADQDSAILGRLTQAQIGDVAPTQRYAWTQQIEILRVSLGGRTVGTLCFEYLIPRVGKRTDNILLIGHTVLVIEFKVGAKTYDRSAINQVIDYALDLKYFHEGSRQATIVPILVATRAPARPLETTVGADGVAEVVFANADTLGAAIGYASSLGCGPMIDPDVWLTASYRPTPSIIEASQALYRGHSVAEITRSEAGADNLGVATEAIGQIIDRARSAGEKAICLVTGVPGAGKTLAGLNLASERRRIDTTLIEHAVFLSGNGPLVRVLQESLARDDVEQAKFGASPCQRRRPCARLLRSSRTSTTFATNASATRPHPPSGLSSLTRPSAPGIARRPQNSCSRNEGSETSTFRSRPS